MQNLMIPNTTISRTVMRRVHVIHGMRVSAPIVAASFLFVLALWGIGREVWVAKVFENMPSYANLPGVLSFFSNAFLHTEIAVQVLSILALGAFVWLAQRFVLTVGESLSLRRV